jgi:hypothetical protein
VLLKGTNQGGNVLRPVLAVGIECDDEVCKIRILAESVVDACLECRSLPEIDRMPQHDGAGFPGHLPLASGDPSSTTTVTHFRRVTSATTPPITAASL